MSAYDCAVSTMSTCAVSLLLFVSCANADSEETQLTVFAAASLSDSFAVIADRFEAAHESVDVRLNFLGSSQLAQQIEQGAPADVFASADTETMKELTAQDLLASEPEVFTTNRMAIVVEEGNPREIREPADLEDPSLVVSLAAPEVPAGEYAREVLANAGVQVIPDSEEQDVRAVVTRVATGEADAGIVYESDAMATSKVDLVPIPPGSNVVARYPIAVLSDADDDGLAQDFVSLVLSDGGVKVLLDMGFHRP